MEASHMAAEKHRGTGYATAGKVATPPHTLPGTLHIYADCCDRHTRGKQTQPHVPQQVTGECKGGVCTHTFYSAAKKNEIINFHENKCSGKVLY